MATLGQGLEGHLPRLRILKDANESDPDSSSDRTHPRAYVNPHNRPRRLTRAGLGPYMGLQKSGSALCRLHTWKTRAKRHLRLSVQPFLP